MNNGECLLPMECDLANPDPTAANALAERLNRLRRRLAEALALGVPPAEFAQWQAALNAVEAGMDIVRHVRTAERLSREAQAASPNLGE